MCFHSSHTKKVKKVELRFNVSLIDEKYRTVFNTPHYHNNGFNHYQSLVIPQQKPSHLIPATWGLVPPNLKLIDIKDYYKKQIKYGSGLNARSEKLFDYWLYKKASATKRCIIPITGFFEPHEHNKKKFPIHIKRKDDELFALAGIYTVVENIVTYTIVTKQASPFMAKIHNKKLRQPVILTKDLEKEWLNGEKNNKEISEIINASYFDDELMAYEVNKDLFNSKTDSNQNYIVEKQEGSLLNF